MALIAVEKFYKWNKDVTMMNDNQTAKCRGVWTNHRTCYGDILISSMNNEMITWNIIIQNISKTGGYVCIGIDSDECKHIDTWFYGNKETTNYSYECTGKMYAFDKEESKNLKGFAKYSDGDFITMTLNTLNYTLAFSKNHLFQGLFNIEKNDKLKYRLAISIKDATVSIVNCTINKNIKDIENTVKKFIDNIKENKEDNTGNKQDNITENKEENTPENKEHNTAENKQDNDDSKVNDNMTEVGSKLNVEIKQFKEKYNETKINEIFNKNALELMDENSVINQDIKWFENGSIELMKWLNDLNEYIKKTKLLIDDILLVNESEFKNWDLNRIIIWIAKLENGRYSKYLNQLRNGFVKSEILKGEYLPDLDVATLSVVPFEINSFPDKRDLIKQFKQLQSGKKDEIIAAEEGTKTAYH